LCRRLSRYIPGKKAHYSYNDHAEGDYRSGRNEYPQELSFYTFGLM